MGYKVDMIADTISPAGKRISTFFCRYPRFIHAELMTHRAFSRNASSSRAIPVQKMITDVMRDPAMPLFWGKNQPGMQAKKEHDATVGMQEIVGWDHEINGPRTDLHYARAEERWLEARDKMVEFASAYADAGYHKQIVNRLLEPWLHINVVITATEWDNFFMLRRHEDAQPEIKFLADLMYEVMEGSTPEVSRYHLPFIRNMDRANLRSYEDCRLVSAARCARTSYLTHDGRETTFSEDLELSTKLSGHPPHLSPFEHQAEASHDAEAKFANLRGWFSQRYSMESLAATLGAVSS